jgi:hypothetical protein
MLYAVGERVVFGDILMGGTWMVEGTDAAARGGSSGAKTVNVCKSIE